MKDYGGILSWSLEVVSFELYFQEWIELFLKKIIEEYIQKVYVSSAHSLLNFYN